MSHERETARLSSKQTWDSLSIIMTRVTFYASKRSGEMKLNELERENSLETHNLLCPDPPHAHKTCLICSDPFHAYKTCYLLIHPTRTRLDSPGLPWSKEGTSISASAVPEAREVARICLSVAHFLFSFLSVSRFCSTSVSHFCQSLHLLDSENKTLQITLKKCNVYNPFSITVI